MPPIDRSYLIEIHGTISKSTANRQVEMAYMQDRFKEAGVKEYFRTQGFSQFPFVSRTPRPLASIWGQIRILHIHIAPNYRALATKASKAQFHRVIPFYKKQHQRMDLDFWMLFTMLTILWSEACVLRFVCI